jgi:hypothetical protein
MRVDFKNTYDWVEKYKPFVQNKHIVIFVGWLKFVFLIY